MDYKDRYQISHDINEAILHYSSLGAGSRAENGPAGDQYICNGKIRKAKVKIKLTLVEGEMQYIVRSTGQHLL